MPKIGLAKLVAVAALGGALAALPALSQQRTTTPPPTTMPSAVPKQPQGSQTPSATQKQTTSTPASKAKANITPEQNEIMGEALKQKKVDDLKKSWEAQEQKKQENKKKQAEAKAKKEAAQAEAKAKAKEAEEKKKAAQKKKMAEVLQKSCTSACNKKFPSCKINIVSGLGGASVSTVCGGGAAEVSAYQTCMTPCKQIAQ